MNFMEDELTMDYVLNVFDGVAELHDALLIFTTNAELECFDPALIRPGRIDLIMKLAECSQKVVCEMLSLHYRISVEEISNLLESKLTTKRMKSICPSYLESIASRNNDIDNVINEIVE